MWYKTWTGCFPAVTSFPAIDNSPVPLTASAICFPHWEGNRVWNRKQCSNTCQLNFIFPNNKVWFTPPPALSFPLFTLFDPSYPACNHVFEQANYPTAAHDNNYISVLSSGSCQALLLISQASSIDTAAGFTFFLFTFIRLASICSICSELELGFPSVT